MRDYRDGMGKGSFVAVTRFWVGLCVDKEIKMQHVLDGGGFPVRGVLNATETIIANRSLLSY
jgi:hypothetical protein